MTLVRMPKSGRRAPPAVSSTRFEPANILPDWHMSQDFKVCVMRKSPFTISSFVPLKCAANLLEKTKVSSGSVDCITQNCSYRTLFKE